MTYKEFTRRTIKIHLSISLPPTIYAIDQKRHISFMQLLEFGARLLRVHLADGLAAREELGNCSLHTGVYQYISPHEGSGGSGFTKGQGFYTWLWRVNTLCRMQRAYIALHVRRRSRELLTALLLHASLWVEALSPFLDPFMACYEKT